MYLPEDISTDYRFAYAQHQQQQQRQYQNRPYFPHYDNYVFKVLPSALAKDGYIESDEMIIDKLSWKVFIKADGKDLYPFMTVGIVNHNNVEEISYKITLKGIKAEYDETRQDTITINDKMDKKLCCNEKIWYHSLFNLPDNSTNVPEMPLIFHISLKYRCPGEKYEYIPFRHETLHSQIIASYESDPTFRRSRKHQWDTSSFEIQIDNNDFFAYSTLQYFLFLYGTIFLVFAAYLEICIPAFLYYCLSLIFTFIFCFFDCCYSTLWFPFAFYSNAWSFLSFFSSSVNVSCNDTVAPSYFVGTKFFDEN